MNSEKIKFKRDKQYWSIFAEKYRSDMNTPYHVNRCAMIDRLIVETGIIGNVLDLVHGDGIYSQKVLENGGKVVAIDANRSMIAHSQSKLGHFEHFSSKVGSIETLKTIRDQAVDTVFALNVIAYLENGKDKDFYREASRILKENGVLLVTHSNELFDMFAFSKYTVDFFKENFSIKEECDIKDFLVNQAFRTVHPNCKSKPTFIWHANGKL